MSVRNISLLKFIFTTIVAKSKLVQGIKRQAAMKCQAIFMQPQVIPGDRGEVTPIKAAGLPPGAAVP